VSLQGERLLWKPTDPAVTVGVVGAEPPYEERSDPNTSLQLLNRLRCNEHPSECMLQSWLAMRDRLTWFSSSVWAKLGASDEPMEEWRVGSGRACVSAEGSSSGGMTGSGAAAVEGSGSSDTGLSGGGTDTPAWHLAGMSVSATIGSSGAACAVSMGDDPSVLAESTSTSGTGTVMTKEKHEPRPTSLCTISSPCICATSWRHTVRPRPVPPKRLAELQIHRHAHQQLDEE
jgi:hypothetical protein